MTFAIAMLIVAAFLLVTGVVGHDTEVGHGGLSLKVTGKVGYIPRFVLLIASAVTLLLALAFALDSPESPSPAPRPGTVGFSVLVGIRPQLGQQSENLELLLDGSPAGAWSADQTRPVQTLNLQAGEGTHSYEIRGDYSYIDQSGALQQRQAYGSGQVTVSAGARLAVSYESDGQFRLVAIP